MRAVRIIVDGQYLFSQGIPVQAQNVQMKQFTDFVW